MHGRAKCKIPVLAVAIDHNVFCSQDGIQQSRAYLFDAVCICFIKIADHA